MKKLLQAWKQIRNNHQQNATSIILYRRRKIASLCGGSGGIWWKCNNCSIPNASLLLMSGESKSYHIQSNYQLSQQQLNVVVDNNKYQFAQDLDIYFSFEYEKQSSHLKEKSSGINFVFSEKDSSRLIEILERAMKILSSSNSQEKVQLTRDAQFLPSIKSHSNVEINSSDTNDGYTMNEREVNEIINQMRNQYLHEYSGKDYIPARPKLPPLLDDMKQIPTTYKQAGVTLPVFLLHNMAHIELNAIDLCWNTIVMALLHPIRFKSEKDIPDDNCLDLFDFINDFIKVAKDEARHFSDLSKRLEELSSFYGAVTSHKAIWSLARDTQYSLLERVVIGNMVLEGRGLDSGERLVSKMVGCGDLKSCGIVKTICHEEEDHVRIGVKWFDKISQMTHHLIEQDQKLIDIPKMSFDDFQTQLFQQIVLTHYGPLPSPFNHDSRRAANMKECWYEDIARPKIAKIVKH